MFERLIEYIKVHSYSQSTFYLLNNWSLHIRDPEIRNDLLTQQRNNFEALFKPYCAFTILMTITAIVVNVNDPTTHSFIRLAKFPVTLVVWFVLRLKLPKFTTLAVFFFLLFDHLLFSLATLGLADWYVEPARLRFA